MSRPSSSTVPPVGRSNPVTTFTSVDLPAPFGPISPTTSRRRTSSETLSSAWTPANARETAEARSVPPGLGDASLTAAAALNQILTTTFALIRPTYFATLFWILITRYFRPNTECRFLEKLTLPEIVGTLRKFSITFASTRPFVDPCARLIAVTTPSTAAGPVLKPPVAAPIFFASARLAGFGSSPNTDAYVTNQ